MDRESVERLRFDRRLAQRRDWVDEAEAQQYLDSLPDVSGKMATVGELETEDDSGTGEAAAEPSAPVSESFGGSTGVGGGSFGGAGSA